MTDLNLPTEHQAPIHLRDYEAWSKDELVTNTICIIMHHTDGTFTVYDLSDPSIPLPRCRSLTTRVTS